MHTPLLERLPACWAAYSGQGSEWIGSCIGAASGFSAGFIAGAGNAWIAGEDVRTSLRKGLQGGLMGGAMGAIGGGISGGVKAHKMGFSNPWRVTLQDKLDYMMAQYKPELLNSIGEGDAEVLVGNNKNLKAAKTGFRNENGYMIQRVGDQVTGAHGLTIEGVPFDDALFGENFTRYSDNKILLSKNTVRGLWKCDFRAEGTLFHEWQHAYDFYSGNADIIQKVSQNSSVYKALLEYRAYQWNPYSPYYKTTVLDYLDRYFKAVPNPF